ncbi:unnamed protein product, partial [Effrenium voratum]
AGIQAQRSLQEYQQTLQGSNTQIESLKKTAVQNREVSKRKAALIKVEEAEELAQQAEASATEIFDPEKVATMSAVEIRKAGDMNQRTFKATMDAVRQAQMMITSLQIEAKNKENAAALSTEYGKLQARLRQAEAAVAHCGTLPPEVQAQLTLKAQIDEVEWGNTAFEVCVESKVKASEEKVGQAEQLAKEAETNPIEEKPEDSKPSAAVNATAKATAAKATAKAGAWKGKAAGKGIEEPAGPVEKAKQSLEAAGLDLKICLRFLEAQSQAGKLPAEDEASLKGRIQAAQERLEAATSILEKAQEKRASLALLGDADKKVLEAEKAVEAAAELAAPLQELMASEDKRPAKAEGNEKDKEAKDEEMKEEKEEQEAKDEVKEEGVKEEEGGKEEKEEAKEQSPLEEALAAMNSAAQVASRQLSNAKTTLAVKRISAKRLPGNAAASCLEQLDALQKRLDSAMKHLAEVRRGSTDRQYAKARKAMAQSITQAEAKVEASKEAFQALIDLPEDADPLEMQTVLQKAAAAQSEATAAIQAARVPLMERLQKAKADGVTTDTSEVLKEFQEMFTKLAQLQSKLDEQRREANDKEHKFVAACLTQEATEMFSNLDKTLENLNAAAAPLIAKGEELQPLLRLGQLLEVLRKHASAASKTPGALWAELAKASGGELLMPKGIIGALKELRPEPDLTDLFGTTEEDERVLLAAAARMDEEATKQEDGGISEEKFLDHMKVRYLCVAVVTMTTEKEVNTKTVRKLEVSEVLEAMSEATREPQSGLLRVECKALQDGAQGFVTVAGSGGTTYLEVYTPFMACVRAAEAALAESHEAVTSTASYLKQKHDELRSTRGTAALTDLKQKLQDLRVRATRAQVAHSDVKQKVTEAKNRYDRQLEAHKKWRQTAAEKLAADTITGEASNMVDELIAKATTACAAASSILSVTSDSASSSSLQALEQVEKDLLAVVEACAEGEGKIMKTVMEEIRNASKGPLFDARRMMFRLKVKLAPLPSNCKKHLKTIQEKKTEMMEDVRRSVGDQLREHALKSQLSADALFDQLRKVSGEAGDEVEDGAISVSSLRSCLGDKDMSSVSALQGFEAGVTRSAFLDLVEEYRKCVKEVALTPALQVKGTPTRKIEVDEVVQVLGQPSTDEPGGLVRAPCRALRDNSEGWITMKGNQ